MEGRGGCCIAKYAEGHVAAYDTSKMDTIMMRFRPIAPKPAVGSASSDGGGAHTKAGPGGKGRRRSTSRRKRKSCSPDRTAKTTTHHGLMKSAVTLPLIPEAPDLSPTGKLQARPIWLSFNNKENNHLVVGDNYCQGDSRVIPYQTAMVLPRQEKVIASYVIVEGITDTWTGDQVMMNRRLEEDKCPGLITDAWYRVWWTNEAYRRMVMGDTWHHQKMAVWVMMEEKVPDTLQAFTCRVRVQRSSDGKESTGSSSTLTLPCDVWRIDGGGWFAWRLDVDAALSLGR
uniref:DUF7950 domain-containing protein n=1 Tax=Opuntia streptacantha TaxID=393608 RepID=A0A7C8ZV59_OPUST